MPTTPTPTSAKVDPLTEEVRRLLAGEHSDPHHVLGPHPAGGATIVRAYRPGATGISVLLDGREPVVMDRISPTGVFAVQIDGDVADYRLRVQYEGLAFDLDDPYRFWPTLGELDLHLIGEGRHETLWRALGAHVRVHQDTLGTSFSVWAPNARSVRIVGEFNAWDGRLNPMRSLGSSGVWELFLPGVGVGATYKFEILTQERYLTLKADPMAFAAEEPPGTASVVDDSHYQWGDADWFERRAQVDHHTSPLSIYEVHLGSWRRAPEEDDPEGRSLTYRELAPQLAEYVKDMGFTHVELMPPAEHPFGGSWGYQVTSYYAPTARFGTPDDFRYFVDVLHQNGIGVIIDWVPAHFPRDDWALARFDGTALYEHADPRKGAHPDWGTLVFNFGRNEVRNFLIANALYWVEELHVDGLRVDAVASMLYLDYSRNEGEWIPNQYGGRENLEAIAFLKEMNAVVYGRNAGVMTVAEESTAWPSVSRPTWLGGLGFGFKWNMGWMHDTLEYFSKDPVHRRYHHHELTFGLLYAFTENFMLPLSHDEVVHGKGALISKMPGDKWQRLANLRSLLAWMWAHPGKQLLFMGGEIGQEREWAHDRSLDWHILEDGGHHGVQDLVRELNRVYRNEPALWEQDFEPSGFRWIDANDSDQSVFSFLRFSADGSDALACVANLTPVPRPNYRIGLPFGGDWQEVLNTDAEEFGGSGMGNAGVVWAEDAPFHGLDHSASVVLPPLSVLWLRNPR
jgi:1,4-alpha-glucan branching enzyme